MDGAAVNAAPFAMYKQNAARGKHSRCSVSNSVGKVGQVMINGSQFAFKTSDRTAKIADQLTASLCVASTY